MPHCNIRPMTPSDLPDVLLIEHEAYEFPWMESEFRSSMRRGSGTICIVAEHDGSIVGYVAFGLGDGELHIHNLAVAHYARRTGIGTQLIEDLQKRLKKTCRSISLEVRESNAGAIAFYSKMKFKATGVLRGFYVETEEDAYAMRFEMLPKGREQPSGRSQPVNRIAKFFK